MKRLAKTLIVALAVFSCVVVSRSFAAESKKIVFAYSSIGSMATGVWMAKDSGAFDKYGIPADIIFISSGPVVVQALIGGDLQGGSGASNAVINAVLNGAPIVAIGGTANRPYHRLFVQSEINRIEDLKGKILGVTRFGSITDNLTRILLRKYGLENSVNVRQMGGTLEVAAAFQNRQIAGAVTGDLRVTPPSQPKILLQLDRSGHSLLDEHARGFARDVEARSGHGRENRARLLGGRRIHEPEQRARSKNHREICAYDGPQADGGSLSRFGHVFRPHPPRRAGSGANDSRVHGQKGCRAGDVSG